MSLVQSVHECDESTHFVATDRQGRGGKGGRRKMRIVIVMYAVRNIVYRDDE